MRIYKLYADVAPGTNAGIAQLDIVEDGLITAISFAAAPIGMDATSDAFQVELSFSSGQTLSNNDIRQSIFEIGSAQNFLTNGGGGTSINHAISGLSVKAIAGERLYLHSFAQAGVTGRVSCHVYVKDGSGGKTRLSR